MTEIDHPTAAAQAADAVSNTQAYQTVANGPVAESAKTQVNATKNEFSNLAAARQTPDVQTATGQNLTHYHSLFYSLLSWENPRATAISYVVLATSVIVARYVPLDRYLLKALFTVLGVTAAAELVGHVALGEGFATKIRPRKYYTIPRETLESILGDVEQLINFFVIEFQRVLFAENLVATLTVSSPTAPIEYRLTHLAGILRCSRLLLPRQSHTILGSYSDWTYCHLLRPSHLHQQP